jgi:hypothetical protein
MQESAGGQLVTRFIDNLHLTHLGIVVKDVVQASQTLSALLGIDSWRFEEATFKKEDLIVGEPFELKLAFGNLKDIGLELLQPITRGSIWDQFIETAGGGVHHLCFDVFDWHKMVSDYNSKGADMIVGGVYKGKRWCYFQTGAADTLIELIEGQEA